MGISIIFKNQKIYKGEKIADIMVKSPKSIKSINCPSKLNSGAIDEFLTIFLVAAKANGISYFKDLAELNQKESPRLKWAKIILTKIGIKTITTKDSIKIYGNPTLNLKKKILIKNYLKDHRVFMTSVIAALSFGGRWNIHDKDSIKTSFPNFLKIINFSDQHKNHYDGDNQDTSHIKIIIVSDTFKDLSRIDRERKVHKVLMNEIKDQIHSLRLKIYSVDEYNLVK
jgi:5-enolpyruvylshikimate-3-phosphate synthase/acid stress-induced BolA-like protein IbaG/YrbA